MPLRESQCFWTAIQLFLKSATLACRQVEWEERWWEASDWAGMREMGAEKSGCGADGSAWRETWREAIAFDSGSGEPIVERSAHKWAHDAKVRALCHAEPALKLALQAQPLPWLGQHSKCPQAMLGASSEKSLLGLLRAAAGTHRLLEC